ncbi:hypothetical protein [Edaphovirga cremea]|uniref:hypothetical protein n=1 Tax=Edaphovirga cremea TaxID=2267246 RepID=UPI000DEF24AA|nr:hypothetical protein [Edaphovirga cremea]
MKYDGIGTYELIERNEKRFYTYSLSAVPLQAIAYILYVKEVNAVLSWVSIVLFVVVIFNSLFCFYTIVFPKILKYTYGRDDISNDVFGGSLYIVEAVIVIIGVIITNVSLMRKILSR